MHTITLSSDELTLLTYALNAAQVDEFEFSQGDSPRLTALNAIKAKLLAIPTVATV